MKNKFLILFLICFQYMCGQPLAHNELHETYIANIQNNSHTIINNATHTYIQKLIFNNSIDVFTYNDTIHEKYGWDINRINCYGNIQLPTKTNIDVSNFNMPIQKSYSITKVYGYIPKTRRMHRGIDLSCNLNDTIVSCWTGCVRLTGYDKDGYGNYVIIRHDNGLETLYAHLSKITVKKNQYVNSNECIGLGGSTGLSSNPHLHFEVRFLGTPLNPQKMIDFNEKTTFSDIYVFEKRNYQNNPKQNKLTSKIKTTTKKKK